MKKLLNYVLIVAVIIGVFSLAGCSSFEKDITVVLKSGNNIVGTLKTTIFRNAITPDMTKDEIPDGKIFLGWAYEENATEVSYGANGLIRFPELKNYIEDDVVILYAIYGEKAKLPSSDLVVGWYAKTSTSGLDEAKINRFKTAFEAFLTSKGHNVSALNMVYRAYDGDVATIGAAINNDGDVNFLLGVGGNITSTGKVETIETIGEIPMGGKQRFIALLTDSELARLAYEWTQTQEAKAALE